jgi:hypothetical protein
MTKDEATRVIRGDYIPEPEFRELFRLGARESLPHRPGCVACAAHVHCPEGHDRAVFVSQWARGSNRQPEQRAVSMHHFGRKAFTLWIHEVRPDLEETWLVALFAHWGYTAEHLALLDQLAALFPEDDV